MSKVKVWFVVIDTSGDARRAARMDTAEALAWSVAQLRGEARVHRVFQWSPGLVEFTPKPARVVRRGDVHPVAARAAALGVARG